MKILEEIDGPVIIHCEEIPFEDLILQHLNFLFSFNGKKNSDFTKFDLLKGASVIIGSLSGVPYMSPANQYAGDNLILGYIYAGSTVVPFGALTVWSLLNYIEHVQQDIDSKYKSKKCTLSLAVIPLCLAACAALPGTIISLNYNQNISYSVIAFLNDFIAETCSYNISLRNFHNKIMEKYKHAGHIRELKNQIKKRLQIGTQVVINKSSEEINEFLIKYKISEFFLEDFNTPINSIDFIRELIFMSKMIVLKRNSSTYSNSVFKYTSYFLSAVLPLTWGITILKLVHDEIQKEINIDSISWTIAALSSISIYFLEAYLTNFIFSKTYNSLLNFYSDSYQKNISQKYYLKTVIFTEIFALIASGFSFAAKAKVVDKEYSGVYNNIAVPFVIASTIIFTMSAVLDFIPNFINSILEKFGRTEEKYLAKLVKIVNSFNVALENSAIEDFKKFLQTINIDRLIDENSEDVEFFKSLRLYKESEKLLFPDKDLLSEKKNNQVKEDVDLDPYKTAGEDHNKKSNQITLYYSNLTEKTRLLKLTEKHQDIKFESPRRSRWCSIQ